MASIQIDHLQFAYDDGLAVDVAELAIKTGEFIALMGPSGCGKTTFLRLVAGLEAPRRGTIDFGDALNAGKDGVRSRLLFQDYDAYPFLTVFENVASGSGSPPDPSDQEVEGMLSAVGLLGSRQKYPAELSGGMRKRLALARCLIRRPSLLLLDEPFSSLDVPTKFEMYELVQRLQAESKATILMVTHDPSEALLLADRVLVATRRPMGIGAVVEFHAERPRTSVTGASGDFLGALGRLTQLVKRAGTTVHD